MRGIADFTGRNIVVVGGSSGIGRQTAIRLSELGAKVSIVARREDKLKEVCCCLLGEHNRYYAKTTRNAIRALRNTTDKAAAEASMPKVFAMIDKLAKSNIIHKNKASNLKSGIAVYVNKL